MPSGFSKQGRGLINNETLAFFIVRSGGSPVVPGAGADEVRGNCDASRASISQETTDRFPEGRAVTS